MKNFQHDLKQLFYATNHIDYLKNSPEGNLSMKGKNDQVWKLLLLDLQRLSVFRDFRFLKKIRGRLE
ncbi:hypothetical protein EO93_18005 [Methanosarcina sp. 1.H.A.2.2]|nr:hypothetical protein EO93_18005 [Methanosarcina sp. 1.H.A.2.2]